MNRTALSVSLLAAIVLVVQFGLAQHAVEHGTAFVDSGCTACVTGANPAPLPAGVGVGPAPVAHVRSAPPRVAPAPAQPRHETRQPRAPPPYA